MSQIIKTNSGGGGGTPITTIDGDTGSITGSTVTIFANNAANNSGSTVEFVNSGSISTLNLSDVDNNTLIGLSAGNLTLTGHANVSLGVGSLESLTSGDGNTCIGQVSGGQITSGSSNSALGSGALGALRTGNLNCALGAGAGTAYINAESHNIVIENAGVAGESHVIRIGTQGSGTGQQNECFIAGVIGNTVSNAELVTVNSSTGQFGVTSSPPATAFFAYPNANLVNVIGSSSFYAPAFNSTNRNDGTAYNTSTGVFTAPKTGFYSFQAILDMLNIVTSTELAIAYTGSVQSQVLTLVGAGSIGVFQNCCLNVAWSMQMTAGDTVYLVIFSNEATTTVSLAGSPIQPNTFTGQSSFSGFLVGA